MGSSDQGRARLARWLGPGRLAYLAVAGGPAAHALVHEAHSTRKLPGADRTRSLGRKRLARSDPIRSIVSGVARLACMRRSLTASLAFTPRQNGLRSAAGYKRTSTRRGRVTENCFQPMPPVVSYIVFSSSSLTRYLVFLLPPRVRRRSPARRYSPP
jgi:hypothetical protein